MKASELIAALQEGIARHGDSTRGVSMARDDGGPAYPVECCFDKSGQTRGRQTSNFSGWVTGLTIRDAFAIAALQGMLAGDNHNNAGKGLTFEQVMARDAYEFADAMLAARNAT